MRLTRPLLCLAVVAVAAGCGSSSHRVDAEGPFGKGADQVWLFRPHGKPKDVVVFVHGLGQHESTPANHRPWLEHLAAGGSAVLYPRYESIAGGPEAIPHILAGVHTGLARLGVHGLPLVAIGFSRGGELVADYAAAARTVGPPTAAVLSVFPATVDPYDVPLDLRGIDRRARFAILVGDRDTRVDGAGARQLLRRLAAAGFPAENVSVTVVRSRPGFTAEHVAPLEVSQAAKAAFWAPADRLVERARAGG
jgi:dienelactone hydrolase